MSKINPDDSAPTEDNREEQDMAATKTNEPFTITISSNTLFNMVAERKRRKRRKEGEEKYVAYQMEHKKDPLKPGAAFPFVKALMNVNTRLRELYPDSEELFDIVLLTNNHAQVGVRLINSINHYGLTEINCKPQGESLIGCLKANNTKLYLSENPEEVKEAINEGIAAATMFMPQTVTDLSDTQLRVAFDGDGVLFSDESEKITMKHGLQAFLENEERLEDTPLTEGPLKCFQEALGKLQRKFYAKNKRKNCPIRTFLVTARGADCSGARVLKTLRSWCVDMNEGHFLDGAPKGPLLQKIKPHIFFDDKMSHLKGAVELGTISAHVPYGISNE